MYSLHSVIQFVFVPCVKRSSQFPFDPFSCYIQVFSLCLWAFSGLVHTRSWSWIDSLADPCSWTATVSCCSWAAESPGSYAATVSRGFVSGASPFPGSTGSPASLSAAGLQCYSPVAGILLGSRAALGPDLQLQCRLQSCTIHPLTL